MKTQVQKKEARVMSKPEDFKNKGINPERVEAWEDGVRNSDAIGNSEVWYFDAHFDDGTTLILAFRPKSVAQVGKKGFNPNIGINYNDKNHKLFYDYRLYDTGEVSMSKDGANLTFGPSTLKSVNWQSYDIHIEPEPDKTIEMEGKVSTEHKTCIDLHFEAITKPFRPGTGWISFGKNDEFFYNFICVTKLTVSGKVTINGEDKHVTGFAYFNHQWGNKTPLDLFHHWLWGRQNTGKYSVLIYDMVAAQKYNFAQIPLFTIDDSEGNRLFENTTTDGMTREVLETYYQAETKKYYPSKVRYTFKQNAVEMEYTISSPKEINTIDIYGMVPWFVKLIFRFTRKQPTYTRYLASTELKITRNGKTETTHDTMLYEFNYTGVADARARLG